MDFPNRLGTIFEQQRDQRHEKNQLVFHFKALERWNNEIEEFLSTPPKQTISSEEVDEVLFQRSLKNVAFQLHRNFLQFCSSDVILSLDYYEDDNIEIVHTMTGKVNEAFLKYKDMSSKKECYECIRTGKNYLRWYIQIYLERRSCYNPTLLQILQSPSTLELVLNIVKWSVKENNDSDNARNASLFLFYAMYSPIPNNDITQKGMNHLVSDLSFPSIVLEILSTTDSIPLSLSLIRNLHNMAVSLQGAGRIILDTTISWDQLNIQQPTIKKAPWLSTESPSTLLSFVSVCTMIAAWSLIKAQPKFPVDDPEDKRSELIVEILNAFYALRIGQELEMPSSVGLDNVDTDGLTLADIVVRILQLPQAANNSEVANDRVRQCKRATVSLLMDSKPSIGKYLVEANVIESLLQDLTDQVNNVVDNLRVDNSATAALVPILVVLNKYAVANGKVRQRVRDCVFPPEREEYFQQKVKEHTASHGSNPNMSPLDAPKDALRGKVVILLSWAESIIKRCTAELLWTLCDSNATKYIHRVGLGNALPLLNAKGLATMPVPS